MIGLIMIKIIKKFYTAPVRFQVKKENKHNKEL